MSAAVSSSMPTYQVPVSAKAKTDDERTESLATKAKEADTGKDAAARVQSAPRDGLEPERPILRLLLQSPAKVRKVKFASG